MQKILDFLLRMSRGSFIFLVALAFFHILIASYYPDLFVDLYNIELGKEITLSFKFWQILRNFLWRLPFIGWIISGMYLFKLLWNDGSLRKLKSLGLFLLVCIFGPFIGYFIMKFDWGFTDAQKEYIKQFIVFWCYIIGINISRWIGAVMVDIITVLKLSVRSIADSV